MCGNEPLPYLLLLPPGIWGNLEPSAKFLIFSECLGDDFQQVPALPHTHAYGVPCGEIAKLSIQVKAETALQRHFLGRDFPVNASWHRVGPRCLKEILALQILGGPPFFPNYWQGQGRVIRFKYPPPHFVTLQNEGRVLLRSKALDLERYSIRALKEGPDIIHEKKMYMPSPINCQPIMVLWKIGDQKCHL